MQLVRGREPEVCVEIVRAEVAKEPTDAEDSARDGGPVERRAENDGNDLVG